MKKALVIIKIELDVPEDSVYNEHGIPANFLQYAELRTKDVLDNTYDNRLKTSIHHKIQDALDNAKIDAYLKDRKEYIVDTDNHGNIHKKKY